MIKDDDDFLPPRLSVPDAVRPLTRGVEVEGSRGDGGFKRQLNHHNHHNHHIAVARKIQRVHVVSFSWGAVGLYVHTKCYVCTHRQAGTGRQAQAGTPTLHTSLPHNIKVVSQWQLPISSTASSTLAMPTQVSSSVPCTQCVGRKSLDMYVVGRQPGNLPLRTEGQYSSCYGLSLYLEVQDVSSICYTITYRQKSFQCHGCFLLLLCHRYDYWEGIIIRRQQELLFRYMQA